MLSSKLMGFIMNPYFSYFLLILLFLAILTWILIELKENSIKQKLLKQNIPYVRIPSVNWTLIRGKRFDLIESNLAGIYGKIFGGNMFMAPIIYVNDAELAHIIMNREFTKFANRRSFTTYDPIWDNFLFTTNDEKWKRLRAIVSPTFSAGKLRKIKHCIDENVVKMNNNLNKMIAANANGNKTIINVKELIGAFTMDTIIQVSMGIKINSLDDPKNPAIKYARRLFGRDVPWKETILFAFAFIWPEFLKFFKLRIQAESMDYFRKCSKEIIRQQREKLEKLNAISSSHKASNFIELILEVEHEQKLFFEREQQQNGNSTKKPFKYVTNDELIAQCIIFFTVGYDTTATTISNTCYTMATNPDKQEKLYKNIIETLEQLKQESDNCTDDPFELITFDTVNRFEYLTACINETMRYLTLATASERVATENCRIESSDKRTWFNVQKGDTIRIPINYLHQDKQNFSDPEKFIPERFINNNDNQEQIFNKYAFMPFGSGPRKCVAANLALLEAKIALVHLFRLFCFKVDSKSTKIPLDFYINAGILISKDITLAVEKR